MLRNIKIRNCLSFLDETNLSFEVTQKAPASLKYSKSAKEDERLSKVIGIVGPNASGKSNLLRVINFLKWFIIDSFGNKPEIGLPLLPFLLRENSKEPSKIDVEFESNATIYNYKVIFSRTSILHETLDVLDLGQTHKERLRFKQLFSREFDENSQEYKIKSHADFQLSEGIREISKKRKNASLISAAIFSNHEPSLLLKNYWANVISRIKQFGEKNTQPLESLVLESTAFYQKHQNFKESAEQIMAKCDLGLTGIDIKKVVMPKQTASSESQEFFIPVGKHAGMDGKIFELPFYLESSGTQQIYVLLSTLLPVLREGGLAVIDELEADLHPELLPALIDLFVSSKTNTKGAQLIFTCHATPLLNSLDKYQILIVAKGPEGASEAWRLDEIEGVRNDDNFFAKYMAGAYGGVPRPGMLGDVAK